MRKDGKFLSFIKDPPIWFLIVWWVLTLCFVAAAIAVVVLIGEAVWAPAVYACAMVTLAYTVYTVIRCAPKVRDRAIERLRRNKYANRFLDDYGIRTLIFALISFVINTAYVVVNGVTAVRYLSVWYACMAAYYLALCLLRGGVLFFGRKAAKKYETNELAVNRAKTKIYLGCGISLLVSEVALVFAVTQIVMDDSHAQTGMILAIATAAYTFYKFILAIVNMVRAKRFSDQIVQSLRNINLIDAVVSMLSLEITLIAVTGSGEDMTLLNAITGGCVCAIAIILGVLMILQAIKKLQEYKNGEQG